ncbi:hypothetical protein NA57DRAFT_75761 [Rhizodiscina lignyota]|uniref:Uncharacterized protein n=1 Tax=Rhizodiscina lignyota TaxID=1504668 RepID=A0A9P4IHX8_9PEZI|nr:hypothetical protein NA57DRAFT_75761 [Rhizodiscina lignyota]
MYSVFTREFLTYQLGDPIDNSERTSQPSFIIDNVLVLEQLDMRISAMARGRGVSASRAKEYSFQMEASDEDDETVTVKLPLTMVEEEKCPEVDSLDEEGKYAKSVIDKMKLRCADLEAQNLAQTLWIDELEQRCNNLEIAYLESLPKKYEEKSSILESALQNAHENSIQHAAEVREYKEKAATLERALQDAQEYSSKYAAELKDKCNSAVARLNAQVEEAVRKASIFREVLQGEREKSNQQAAEISELRQQNEELRDILCF